MLRHVDGFDMYSVASWASGYSKYGNTNSGNLSFPAGAYGFGQAMQQGVNNNSDVRKTLDAQDTLIIGAHVKIVGGAATDIFHLYSNTGGGTLSSYVQLTAGKQLQMQLQGVGAKGALSAVLATGGVYWIEYKHKIHATTGVMELQVNGVVAATFTGDTRPSGSVTTHNGFSFGFAETFSGIQWWIDNLVVYDGQDGTGTQGAANNDFGGEVRIDTLKPNGVGNSSGLARTGGTVSGNYTAVNEVGADGDTSYVSGTSGEDTYAMTDLANATGVVKGVNVVLVARKDDVAARTIAPVVRSGGAEVSGTAQALGASYAVFEQFYGQNPVGTPAAWTPTTVNAAEIGAVVA